MQTTREVADMGRIPTVEGNCKGCSNAVHQFSQSPTEPLKPTSLQEMKRAVRNTSLQWAMRITNMQCGSQNYQGPM